MSKDILEMALKQELGVGYRICQGLPSTHKNIDKDCLLLIEQVKVIKRKRKANEAQKNNQTAKQLALRPAIVAWLASAVELTVSNEILFEPLY